MHANKSSSACAFPQCGREAWALGLCATHYRQQSTGKPLTPIKPQRPRVPSKQIIELWDEGLSQSAITDRTGATELRIKNALQAAGRKWEPRRYEQPRASHGQPGKWVAGCKCEVCQTAKAEYKSAEYLRLKQQYRANLETLPHPSSQAVMAGCRCQSCSELRKKDSIERQERTKRKAVGHGNQWTAQEVATAIRQDLTIEQIAKILGRTYAAVSNVRAAIADSTSQAHDRYTELLKKAQKSAPN